MALLDNVKKALSAKPEIKSVDQGGIESLLRAKSGKAVGKGGARSSGLGAKMALADVTERSKQAAMAGKQAAGGLQAVADQQTQQSDLMKAKQFQQFEQNNAKLDQSFQTLLEDVRQSKETLGLRKDAHKVEMAGLVLRAQNQMYIQNLNQVAAERRLDNALNFREETARLMLGEEFNRKMDDLGMKSWLFSDQRSFDTAMAEMSIEDAIAASEAAIEASKQGALMNGLFGLGQAGIQASVTDWGGGETFEDMPEGGPLANTPSSEPYADSQAKFGSTYVNEPMAGFQPTQPTYQQSANAKWPIPGSGNG